MLLKDFEGLVLGRALWAGDDVTFTVWSSEGEVRHGRSPNLMLCMTVVGCAIILPTSQEVVCLS